MTSRTGFALFLTLVAILLTSALIAGTMFRVAEHAALARIATLRLHATQSVLRDLWLALDDPSLAALRAAPVGTVKMSSFSAADRVSTVAVTKVDTTMLWFVAATTVRRGRSEARSRMAVSAAFDPGAGGPVVRPIAGAAWVELY